VALWVGNGSDCAFANLTITPTAPAGTPPESRQTIFQAAATGNIARLRSLVEANASAANARRPDGLTPMHMVALYGQRDAAEYLLSKGADVNAAARHSGTPLDVAWEGPDRDFAAWLESKGARATPLRFDVTTITRAVHRLAFPWGMMNNVLVFSGADGAVVVDSGFSRRAVDELRKAILGWSPQGVRYVVTSHPHGDHVAGNALAPGPAAVITAGALDSPPPGAVITRRSEMLKGRTGRTLPAGYAWRTGGAEITLVPVPGLHSEVDLIVWFPGESVLAMGDLLLSESVPAVDDIAAYLSFLDDVLDVFPEKTTFVSGHGRDLSAAGVRTYRDDLLAMVAVVRTQLAAGRTAEQMVAADVLKDFKAKYSLLDFLGVDTLIPRAIAGLQKGALK
jgi:glyoxylase-like metal-dependent hydrolase (beta-lactamase superfamily II)